jgi:hypothetical protein
VKIAGPVVFLYPSGFAGSAVVVNAVFDNREERIPALAELTRFRRDQGSVLVEFSHHMFA